MSILDIHARLGYTSLYFSIAMAAWGLWRFFRRQGIDGNYWGALAIAEILYAVQSIVGLIMYVGGFAQPLQPLMHILYGVVNIVVVPAIFFFTHGESDRRVQIIYALGFAFLIPIFWRLTVTGL